ncbi:MAG: NusG domain II-containing protein [Proteobacteria bacterium]|nr:NusG domain II-containing protein [Pseudomonadota bacterium]
MTFREVWKSVITPADKVLIVILLLLGMSSYFIIRQLFPPLEAMTAVVEVQGREMMRLSLSTEIPDRQVPLKLEGGEAMLDVAAGRVRVLPMPDHLCSKHICSKTGWIGKPWQVIVCLPNKIIVRVVGQKETGDIDLIAK